MTQYGPPTEGVTTPPTAEAEHDFDPGQTGMSDRCSALVMRDGAADDCGLPRVHATHGLDPWCGGCNPKGQSAYAPCARHAAPGAHAQAVPAAMRVALTGGPS